MTRESNIGPAPREALDVLERARLRDQVECYRRALEHYARPMTLGTGTYAVFIDVGGVARAALAEAE